MLPTVIIKDSPLAQLATAWDHLLEDVALVERRLGWRYLWEGESFRQRCLGAARSAAAEYLRVTCWEASGDTEVAARLALMSDLCRYERAFTNIATAIEAWPEMPAGAPEPQLAVIITRAA